MNHRREKYHRDTFRLALTQEEILRRGYTTGPGRFFTNNFVTPIHYLSDGNSDAALRLRTQPASPDSSAPISTSNSIRA